MSNQEYQPIYGIYKNQDVMIPMRDGVRMNLNVLKMRVLRLTGLLLPHRGHHFLNGQWK